MSESQSKYMYQYCQDSRIKSIGIVGSEVYDCWIGSITMVGSEVSQWL